MASPFQFFRKNQKVMMVAVTALALFAFVVMDSLMQMSGPGGGQISPVITILLLAGVCAGVMWFFGAKQDKGGEYALTGAVAGAVIAIVFAWVQRPAPMVETSIGNLTTSELESLGKNRELYNQFLFELRQVAQSNAVKAGKLNEFKNDMRPIRFSDEAAEQDLVLEYILQHEADRMGITISDDLIHDFILNEIAKGYLSSDDFRDLCKRFRVSQNEIYNRLGNLLKAKIVSQLLFPADRFSESEQHLLTPLGYWDLFQRMEIKQELAHAALPVGDFAGNVPEPDESQLQAFFEQYKTGFPQPDGTPGFLQPPRVKIACVEADYDTFAKKVKQPTDEEIAAYYEANKESKYRQTAEEFPGNSNENPTEGPPEEGPELTPTDEGDGEIPPANGSDIDRETPADPGDPPALESDNDQSARQVTPATSFVSFQDEAAGDDGTPAEGPAEAESQDNSVTEPMGEIPEEETTQPHELDTSDPDNVTQTQPAGNKTLESTDETPTDESGNTDSSNAGENGTNETEEIPDSTDTSEAGTTEVSEDTSEGETIDENDPTKKEKYRPLDDDLKKEIADELTTARVRELVDNLMAKADAELFQQRNDHWKSAPPEEKEEDRKKRVEGAEKVISAAMKKFAGENDLKYISTDFLSLSEFDDSELSIVGASESTPTEFGPGIPVRQVIYRDMATTHYLKSFAEKAQEDNENHISRFLLWTTDGRESLVPEYDDEGIRDQVLAAWKLKEAYPLAESRAKEIAEMVRKSDKSFEETLADVRIRKDKDSDELVVLDSEEAFSWYRRLAIPAQFWSQIPPVSMSTPTGIENPGDEFMSVIFEELKPGDVGVAPNADKTVIYVVKPKNRTPDTEGGMEALHSKFMQEQHFRTMQFNPRSQRLEPEPSVYRLLYSQDLQKMNSARSQQLLKDYNVKIGGVGA